MKDITIIRGDTEFYKFPRRDKDDNIILTKAKKIYFTVKIDYYTKKVLIQKTIDDMTFDSEGYYHFTINPEDTDNLEYSDNCVYDIEVIEDNYKKTIARGKFIIDKEVTFARNEV